MANKWDLSEEGKAYHKNYQRKNTQFSINLRKDSGILPLLDAACAKTASREQNTSVLQSQSVWKKRGMRRDIRHLPLTTPE